MILKTIIVALFTFVICLAGTSLWAVDDDAIMDTDDLYAYVGAGSWTQSSWAPCAVGGSYKYAWGSDDAITFHAPKAAAITGEYAVYARWTSHPNRANHARYRIYDTATLRATVYVNQEQNGCTWVYLATVTLTEGNYGGVALDNPGEDSTEATIADAVRFVRVSKDKDDIVDMPGVDFVGGDHNTPLTDTATVIRSISVNAPRAGYVIVSASGNYTHQGSGNDWGSCSITTGTTHDDAYSIYADDGGASTPNIPLGQPFSGTRGFSVSAGTTTFNLVCYEGDGNLWIHDTSMTAIFSTKQY